MRKRTAWSRNARGQEKNTSKNLNGSKYTTDGKRVPAGPRSSAPARRHKNNHNAATIGSALTNTRAHSHATVASHGVGTPPQATPPKLSRDQLKNHPKLTIWGTPRVESKSTPSPPSRFYNAARLHRQKEAKTTSHLPSSAPKGKNSRRNMAAIPARNPQSGRKIIKLHTIPKSSQSHGEKKRRNNNGVKSQAKKGGSTGPKPTESFSLLDLSPALQKLVGNRSERKSKNVKSGSKKSARGGGKAEKAEMKGLGQKHRPSKQAVRVPGEIKEKTKPKPKTPNKPEKPRKPTKMKKIIEKERMEVFSRNIIQKIIKSVTGSTPSKKRRRHRSRRSPLENFLIDHHPAREQEHVRSYCHQVVSPKLNELVRSILQELYKFQSRAIEKKAIKGGRMAKRRYVCGMREVIKCAKTKRLRHVIMAPNIEPIKSEGGLDSMLQDIFKVCKDRDVPITFALSRGLMGKALKKKSKVSMVGIIDPGGVNDTFFEMVQVTEQLRAQWEMFHQDTFYQDHDFLRAYCQRKPKTHLEELKLKLDGMESKEADKSSKVKIPVTPSKLNPRAKPYVPAFLLGQRPQALTY
ncbi:hypothetical protein AAMO2058_000497700 [Amorphochlora amoebiformis]